MTLSGGREGFTWGQGCVQIHQQGKELTQGSSTLEQGRARATKSHLKCAEPWNVELVTDNPVQGIS